MNSAPESSPEPSPEPSREKTPTPLDVLLPVLVLIGCLLLLLNSFSDNAGGYTQLALVAAAITACLVGLKNRVTWAELEDGMINSVTSGLKAILVLLVVGGLVGSWILAGTVPAMIYWGTQLLSPQWFYPAAALICAVTGLSIGSSWTVAGALGVGLMGVASVMGLSPAITAGAILSGAYMGDKLSPLSDTTNLAAGVTGNDLFRHIRHMGWTTIPAFVISLLVFVVVGSGGGELNGDLGGEIVAVNRLLGEQFYLGLPVFVPLLVVLTLALLRKPVLPALMAGMVAGVLVALLFQTPQVTSLGGGEGDGVMIKGVAIALMDGFAIESGNSMVDDLLSKGGMGNMLSTVFLIICALTFGGAFERAGLLKRAVDGILNRVKTVGGLISATLATSFGVNVTCADQYISVVMPARMYKDAYRQRGLHPLNLSRAVEDAGTITSVLIPWNTCGIYMAGVLGVTAWGWGSGLGAFAYAPWAIFCWLCPIISAIYGYTAFKVLPLKTEPEAG
ncbi:Na+/H+ antiporter NhaC [Porticoccus sp. W117]|uniref:Na+/H+ antiporter NhaC n=1 Tax=Porticoccus sp. W117 TaxID=3054777 RepID=UPI00259505D0|nr:Na+/H+ antiporter NhaC [Porticoccus sp. W117]MDM3870735.1 Na+/H+ antiporter NhaC [Porticoccus sp. W117]